MECFTFQDFDALFYFFFFFLSDRFTGLRIVNLKNSFPEINTKYKNYIFQINHCVPSFKYFYKEAEMADYLHLR